MQGAQQEGQNTRMVKRNMLLFMWAAGCGHRNPLENVFFFSVQICSDPSSSGQWKGEGGAYILARKKSITALNGPQVIAAKHVIGAL